MSDELWDELHAMNNNDLADALDRVPDKGVQFEEPPSRILEAMTQKVQRAASLLPDGKRGAIISTATTVGWNAAVVSRFDHDWTIEAWIGSKWGHPVYRLQAWWLWHMEPDAHARRPYGQRAAGVSLGWFNVR